MKTLENQSYKSILLNSQHKRTLSNESALNPEAKVFKPNHIEIKQENFEFSPRFSPYVRQPPINWAYSTDDDYVKFTFDKTSCKIIISIKGYEGEDAVLDYNEFYKLVFIDGSAIVYSNMTITPYNLYFGISFMKENETYDVYVDSMGFTALFQRFMGFD